MLFWRTLTVLSAYFDGRPEVMDRIDRQLQLQWPLCLLMTADPHGVVVPVSRWKWLFMLEGAITVVFGVLFYVSLHCNPFPAQLASNTLSCFGKLTCACRNHEELSSARTAIWSETASIYTRKYTLPVRGLYWGMRCAVWAARKAREGLLPEERGAHMAGGPPEARDGDPRKAQPQLWGHPRCDPPPHLMPVLCSMSLVTSY